MSAKVRLIMAVSASALMLVVFALLLLQSNLHENWSLPQTRLEVPDLGPTESRPETVDLKLMTDSETQTLSRFRGKVVYLNFWATWCVPCKVELPIIENLQKKFGTDQLRVVLINMDYGGDAVNDARKMQRSVAPSVLPVYSDTQVLQQELNVQMLPFHFVIDKQGRTAAAFYAPLERHQEKFERLLAQLISEEN